MSRFVLAAVGLAAGIIGLAAPASAATLTPLSYTFDQPTNTGAYTYNDTGAELIDGILGTAGWAYNAGVEWDGWVSVPQVNIDFNFGSAKTFNSVSVGSTHGAGKPWLMAYIR